MATCRYFAEGLQQVANKEAFNMPTVNLETVEHFAVVIDIITTAVADTRSSTGS